MPKKIVVIEDEPEIAAVIADALICAGYASYTAQNGPDGLALIKKESPSLVLLDLGLPGMNGLEVLEELHRNHSHVSVLVLSGNKDSEMVKKALAGGASEYITKPIHIKTLLNQFVRDLIGPPYT